MLKFCPECGARLVEGFKFCGQCGTKIPTLEMEQEEAPQAAKAEGAAPASEPVPAPKVTGKPMPKAAATRKRASKTTAIDKPAPAPAPTPKHEIKIGKYKLCVDETVIAYNDVRKIFVDYAKRCASAFETYYAANVKDFEGLYEKALPRVIEEAAKAIEFATATLQEYGLPTLTEEDFLLYAQDSIHLDRDFQEYTDAARDIVDFVEQLNSYRAAQRSRGGQWVGGGFGLRGAIGGALMAGTLNLGTQAIRGIGNAVVNSADRARLKKVYIELYNTRDHKEFISQKLYSFCVELFDPARQILEDTGLLVHPPLDTMTGLGPMNEGLGLVNGKRKVSKANYERAIELALQGMSYDPYWLVSYLTLYQVPQIKRKEVKKLAQYFGVEREFSVKAKELEAETVAREFDRLPAGTPEEIDAKIAKAEELNKELCYTKVSVTKLQKAKEKIVKKLEEEAEMARKKKEEEEARAKKLEEDKVKYKELKKLPEETLQQLEEKRNELQKIEGIPATKKELERLEKLIEAARWEEYKRQVQEAFPKAFPAGLDPKKYAAALAGNSVFRALGDKLDRDLFRTMELVRTVCETRRDYYDIYTKADLADPKTIRQLQEKRQDFAPYGDAEVPIMCVKEYGDSSMLLTNHRIYIKPDNSDSLPINFPLNEIRSFSITAEVVGFLRTKYTYLSVSEAPRFRVPTTFLEKLGKERFLSPIQFFVNYCLFLAASHETQSDALYLDVLRAAGISQEDFERSAAHMSVDEIKTGMERARVLIREKDYDGIWTRVKQGDTCMQYALESHYLKAVIKADPNDSADHENEVAAVIQGIAKGEDKQCLFAQYLEARLWEEYCDRNELDESPYEEKIFALADAGLYAAKAMKGILMIRDDEDAEDREQAGVALLREAAQAGDPTALAWMGALYRAGACGFPVDRAKAEQFLTRGAAYDLSFAVEELKELREEVARQEKKSSSGCFITSAVCRVLGKPDDCYELTAFRGFRDGWLAGQPDGQRLIRAYYQTAPKIVQQIDSQSDSEKIYQTIWEAYLVPCLRFIEQNQPLQCKETYVAMVTELEEKYLQQSS